MLERRSRFLINKSLQFRFMAYVTGVLLTVSAASIISFYFGIWGGVLDAFSDAKIREDLLTASRISQYEEARIPVKRKIPDNLAFFKEAEQLSQRQQEVFKTLLDETNKKMIPKFLGLFLLIAWGSIYLSHKMAGPLYRFQVSLEALEKGNMAMRIKLREGDEGKLLGAQFNETAESLDAVFSRLKKIINENENPAQLKAKLNEELSKITTSAER